MLVAEPATEAAETTDHFIAHQQDAVLLADGSDTLPIAARRNDDTTSALHRLADERRHAICAQLANALFKRIGRTGGKGILALGEAVTEFVGLHDVLNTRNR